MFIKLAIICSVLLVTVIVFQDEIYQLFPETSSSIIDVTTNDFDKIKDDAIEKTGTTITAGGKLINNQVQDFAKDSTEKISESINDFSESAQQVVTVGIFGNDKNENNNESSDERHSSSTKIDSSFTTIATKGKTIQTFETLSLKSSQQSDDNIMLQYEDTSGKTNNVIVTLRTSEKELFTGIFYSSKFETVVQDVTKTSYFIDLVIEHEEYGTISSSVFNPVDSPDTIINGVFSKS